MSLVKKAKKIKTKKTGARFSIEERIDLAIEFIKGNLTTDQCAKALEKKNNGGVYSSLGSALLSGAKNGIIEVKKVKEV